MKKAILLSSTMALVAIFPSCSGGDNKAEMNYNLELGSLITDTQTGKSSLSDNNYAFNYNYTNNTMQMRISSLEVGSSTLSFLSPNDVKFTETSYPSGLVTQFAIPEMKAVGSSSIATDVNAEIATAYNYNPVINVITKVWRRFIISYKIDNQYRVNTFEKTTYWYGVTNTTYEMQGNRGEFSTQAPIYYIEMDINKKTATVTICNAQFAQNMPTIPYMKLANLTLSADNGKYIISGENIVPQVSEGDGWTPNATYTFDNFTLSTSNETLTAAAISFSVAGRFHAAGNFSSTLN